MAACLRRNTLACVDDTSIKEEDSVSGQPVQMQAEIRKLKGKQGLQVSGGLEECFRTRGSSSSALLGHKQCRGGDRGFDNREPDCQVRSPAEWDEGGKEAIKPVSFIG